MEKYEKLSSIGEGSYAVVYKCINKDTGQEVAIKRFKDTEEDPIIRKTALQEIKMLKQLKHPHLVNLIEAFRRKRRLHLVLEYCDHTLLTEIENNPRRYPQEKAKKIIYQLLQALKFCHDNDVIHRDVKPENILLSKGGFLKLCDFGFARQLEPNDNLTEYVATRWYRAPELLVGDTRYGYEVDIWAAGCVLAEVMTGKPLYPGRTDLDMLYLVRMTNGDLISKHMQIFRKNQYFRGMKIKDPITRVSIKARMPATLSSDGVEFLERCLDRDPDKRWTCDQLLNHKFFKNFSFRLPQCEMEKFQKVDMSPTSLSQSKLFPRLASNPSSHQENKSHCSSPESRSSNLKLDKMFEHLPNI